VLKTRRVPHLVWKYDESIEEAARMDSLIRQALERDRKIHEQGRPPAPEPEDWEKEYEEFADEDSGQPPP
jgi:hypothetical protein